MCVAIIGHLDYLLEKFIEVIDQEEPQPDILLNAGYESILVDPLTNIIGHLEDYFLDNGVPNLDLIKSWNELKHFEGYHIGPHETHQDGWTTCLLTTPYGRIKFG